MCKVRDDRASVARRYLSHAGRATLCLIVLGCSTERTAGHTLADLIDRSTEARGGREAIEAIYDLEAKFHIVEPTYEADGVWRVDRRGRMHIDVFIENQRVFTEAFDGQHGWQQSGDQKHGVAASAGGAAALRRSGQLPVNILGLHEMEGHGHHLVFEGREEVAGVSYYVIVLTLDDGFETRNYLDPSTYLITRARVRKALHPDVDSTKTTIETVWSDFREVAGVQFPFQATETDVEKGKLLQTVTCLDVRANRPLDEELFRMP